MTCIIAVVVQADDEASTRRRRQRKIDIGLDISGYEERPDWVVLADRDLPYSGDTNCETAAYLRLAQQQLRSGHRDCLCGVSGGPVL